MMKLDVIDGGLPLPPYPSDTAIKGWRLELDYELINESRSWILAPPAVRPWVLMMFYTAWQQRPAGSFEADGELIAARIGMPHDLYLAHAKVLLAEWARHSDGRYYHPWLTERVKDALAKRAASRERQQRRRKRLVESDAGESDGDVTRDSRVSHAASRVTNALVTTPGPGPEPGPVPEGEEDNTSRAPQCPYGKIRALWIEICTDLENPISAEKWTPGRKNAMRSLWRRELPTLEHWERFFRLIAQNDFLCGRIPPPKGRNKPWRASLDWVLERKHLIKIIERNYD